MRKQRQEEKRRQKAMGSSLIQSLRDELTERPTEETALGLPDEKVGMDRIDCACSIVGIVGFDCILQPVQSANTWSVRLSKRNISSACR